jgi:hypothetical protein
MAKGFTTRPRFHEEAAQRRVCPHCGCAEARRNGTRKGKQMFLCYACRKTWFGEMPTPPVEQICPYCKGYCTRHGTFLEPFDEWYTLPVLRWREVHPPDVARLSRPLDPPERIALRNSPVSENSDTSPACYVSPLVVTFILCVL